MSRRARFVISGRVQGVCYRMCCQDAALGAGVTGWVRNLTDGRVEVVAEGEEAQLAQLLEWCRRGPGMALVRVVEETYTDATGALKGFEVRY